MMKSDLITIHEFAELCRTTVRTIRFYDKLGLLKPVKINEWTKYRYYSPYQMRDFFRIRLLQSFNIPLAEIKEKIKVRSPKELEEKMEQVKQELLEKKKEFDFLRNIKDFFFKEKLNLKKILKTESFGPYILFGTYVERGRYDKINADIKFAHKTADKLKIRTRDREMVFYLDLSTYKPRDTRLEVTVITRLKKIPKLKLPENFFFRTFPKTRAYTYLYRGPYEFITLVYEKLHENNILRLQNISPYPFDLHIFGPLNKKSPYDHLTKIAFPLTT